MGAPGRNLQLGRLGRQHCCRPLFANTIVLSTVVLTVWWFVMVVSRGLHIPMNGNVHLLQAYYKASCCAAGLLQVQLIPTGSAAKAADGSRIYSHNHCAISLKNDCWCPHGAIIGHSHIGAAHLACCTVEIQCH